MDAIKKRVLRTNLVRVRSKMNACKNYCRNDDRLWNKTQWHCTQLKYESKLGIVHNMVSVDSNAIAIAVQKNAYIKQRPQTYSFFSVSRISRSCCNSASNQSVLAKLTYQNISQQHVLPKWTDVNTNQLKWRKNPKHQNQKPNIDQPELNSPKLNRDRPKPAGPSGTFF